MLLPNTRRASDVRRFAFLFVLLTAIAALWPAMAFAQSTVCATINETVARGGVVDIDVSDCDGPFDAGMSTPLAGYGAVNGTVTLDPATGGVQFVHYAHNGSATASDSFQLEDEFGDLLTINVVVTAPSSSIAISPATLPAMTAGVPYTQTLTSTGGNGGPYTYSLGGGALPGGLALASNGTLSGTPSERGNYSFSVNSTDGVSTANHGYTGIVGNPTLAMTPTSGTAIQTVPFTATVAASGGIAPYTYTIEAPQPLPAGLSISPTGTISGTPTGTPGIYNVGVRVTDSSTGTASYFEVENYTLTLLPPPTVTVAVVPASVSEDGTTNLVYTVTRAGTTLNAITVNLTYTGTASSASDYTGNVATVSIPAGATTATVTLDPTVDGTVEPNETVIVSAVAGAGYALGATPSATGNILNDDVPTATIAVAPASVTEDGAGTLVYTVTLSQAPLAATTVGFSVSGTATNSVDYASIVTFVNFPIGATTRTVIVDPIADATVEADEIVSLALNAGAGYTVGAPSNANGTIVNDDFPNLTINDASVTEGDAGTTNATFTVTLSAPAPAGGVTFNIATADGTALAGQDYVAVNTSGTIAAGATQAVVNVPVNGDLVDEVNETFLINVTGATNAVVVDGQGVGTINDDDAQPVVSINGRTVLEGNVAIANSVFTITLSAPSSLPIDGAWITTGNTATAPGDFIAAGGSYHFDPGQTTLTIGVPIVGDQFAEPDETFFIDVSAAINATISPTRAQVTIANDDVPMALGPASFAPATVGQSYTDAAVATGGTAPYTYAIAAGALPSGMTLSPTGALGGIPIAGGTFNFTITATDSSTRPAANTASVAYTLTVNAPTINLPATTLPNGTLTVAYNATINAATGGTAPITYFVSAGALPPGLGLNPSTGAITGTPSVPGTFNFALTAQDSSTGSGPYTSAPRGYSISIVDITPVANAVSLSVAYNAPATPVALNITGGAPDSVAVASAPANGIATASGLSITYQPNAGFAGVDTFTYTATNAGGTSAPATVTVTVGNPTTTITASGGFAATVATPYTQTFTFNGGAAPWSGFAVTNLPAGVSITGNTANTVTIAGTPTQAGSFALNVSATDSSSGNGPFTVAQNFTLTVAAPTLTLTPGSTTLDAPYATAFSQAFSASGGIGPYTYAVTGALPAGLAFSGDTLSGTPTAPGTYPITVTATDTGSTGTGAPFAVAASYTITVAAPTISITPASLPDATAGTGYSQTLSASGGVAPYTYSLSAGALPVGMAFSTGSTLSGTPNASGTFNFTVQARDANGQIATQAYSLVVAVPSLTLTPATLPGATAGIAYSQALTITGGIAPYTASLAGTLPAGLVFDAATRTIAGTPTESGTFNVSVTVADSTSGTAATTTNAYTLVVAVPSITLTPATLPDATAGTAYSQTFTIAGGIGPYTASLTGTLPAGVVFDAATRTIAGTPTESGTFNFSITATDATTGTAATTTNAYTLVVATPAITLTPATLAGGTAGTAYTQALTVSGGIAPYTATLTGALPAGITFDAATRTFAGTPTEAGTFNVSVTVTDSTGGTAATVTNAYTLVIASPTLTLTPDTIPAGTAGTAYTQSLTIAGGIAPYTATLTGTLPAGITFDAATRTFAGTPTQAGTFDVAVTVTDSTGGTAATITHAYTLVIASPTLTLTPATLASGFAGVAYAQSFSTTGGIAPYTYAISAGALPAGLTLNASTGALTGTPTVAGSFAFTVDVVDSTTGTAATASHAYTLAIAAPTITITPTTLAAGTQNQAYAQTLTATGGSAPYTFAVTTGALPDGLVLASGGALSGTPTADGSFAFTVTATDALGFTAAQAYTVAVISRPDPTRDPEVRGLLDAQAQATQRFANAQINNFQQRLESLHGAGARGLSSSISLNARMRCPEAFRGPKQDLCTPQSAMQDGTSLADAPGSDLPATTADGAWGAWVGGAIRSGSTDARNGAAGADFETDGLSVGADWRLSKSFVFGAGLGYGRDRSDVGERTSRVDGESFSVVAYASYHPGEAFFLDGLVGYQDMRYDLRRFLTINGGSVTGARDGTQWFASLSSGADIVQGNVQYTPYARLDVTRATLDAYTEQGDAVYALAYGEQNVDATTGNVGLRVEMKNDTDWGAFSPMFRAEYQHDFKAEGFTTMRYADLVTGPVYGTEVAGFDRSRWMLGLGANFEFDRDFSIRIEYRGVFGSSGDRDNALQFIFQKSY